MDKKKFTPPQAEIILLRSTVILTSGDEEDGDLVITPGQGWE